MLTLAFPLTEIQKHTFHLKKTSNKSINLLIKAIILILLCWVLYQQIFARENIDELSKKIESLLSDNIYAEKLAQNGYSFVKEKCSGETYINNYKGLITAD